jgi:hypothetical protein
MAIPILRILDAGQKGYLNLASRILTVVLVVVFTVWSVDTVLWLGVQIMQYPLAAQSLMHSHQVSVLPQELVTQTGTLCILKNTAGCIVVPLAQVTL